MTRNQYNEYVACLTRERARAVFDFDDEPESSYGWVYILNGIPGIYKIGKAKELTNRIKQLAIQLPFPVSVRYAFYTSNRHYVERSLHRAFASSRMNGEWFELSENRELPIIEKYAGYSGLYEENREYELDPGYAGGWI